MNSSPVQSADELWSLAKITTVTFCGTSILPNVWFLNHNIGSRHARKPIKGSKNSDYRVVPKTLEPKQWLVGLAPRAR